MHIIHCERSTTNTLALDGGLWTTVHSDDQERTRVIRELEWAMWASQGLSLSHIILRRELGEKGRTPRVWVIKTRATIVVNPATSLTNNCKIFKDTTTTNAETFTYVKCKDEYCIFCCLNLRWYDMRNREEGLLRYFTVSAFLARNIDCFSLVDSIFLFWYFWGPMKLAQIPHSTMEVETELHICQPRRLLYVSQATHVAFDFSRAKSKVISLIHRLWCALLSNFAVST